MIDIHAHILPGIDDGARDIFDTMEMAQMAVNSGVSAIVATPHCNIPGMFRNFFAEDYIHIYEGAVKVIQDERIPLKLLPGMEVYGTHDLPDLLVDKKIMPINQSRYVLIEFAFDEDPGFVTDLLNRVHAVGAKPIVAHPERYEFVQENPNLVYEWRTLGYYTQINKGSFVGRFGKRARDTAYQLLNHNMVTVIASDAHSPYHRTTVMMDAYEELRNSCTRQQLAVLFHENPARICNNQLLMTQKPLRILENER